MPCPKARGPGPCDRRQAALRPLLSRAQQGCGPSVARGEPSAGNGRPDRPSPGQRGFDGAARDRAIHFRHGFVRPPRGSILPQTRRAVRRDRLTPGTTIRGFRRADDLDRPVVDRWQDFHRGLGLAPRPRTVAADPPKGAGPRPDPASRPRWTSRQPSAGAGGPQGPGHLPLVVAECEPVRPIQKARTAATGPLGPLHVDGNGSAGTARPGEASPGTAGTSSAKRVNGRGPERSPGPDPAPGRSARYKSEPDRRQRRVCGAHRRHRRCHRKR